LSSICEISDCTLENFESETKCVLHCDKTLENGWILSNKYILPKNHRKSLAYPEFQWDGTNKNGGKVRGCGMAKRGKGRAYGKNS
jgi:hypothetical protein